MDYGIKKHLPGEVLFWFTLILVYPNRWDLALAGDVWAGGIMNANGAIRREREWRNQEGMLKAKMAEEMEAKAEIWGRNRENAKPKRALNFPMAVPIEERFRSNFFPVFPAVSSFSSRKAHPLQG
jgi:hypothetical protein